MKFKYVIYESDSYFALDTRYWTLYELIEHDDFTWAKMIYTETL